MSVGTGTFQSQPSETPIPTTKRTAGCSTDRTAIEASSPLRMLNWDTIPLQHCRVPSLLLQQLYVEMGCLLLPPFVVALGPACGLHACWRHLLHTVASCISDEV